MGAHLVVGGRHEGLIGVPHVSLMTGNLGIVVRGEAPAHLVLLLPWLLEGVHLVVLLALVDAAVGRVASAAAAKGRVHGATL